MKNPRFARTRSPLLSMFAVLLAAAIGFLPVVGAAGSAPEFKCTTLSGGRFTPETLHDGRPYAVLTFFGVNCLPCQKKIAQLNEIWQSGRLREKAVFYAVNADGFPAEKLEHEIARRGIRIEFPVVPDVNQVVTNLYVDGIVPLTVVIDNEFNVVLSMLGARPESVKKMEDRILNPGKENPR